MTKFLKEDWFKIIIFVPIISLVLFFYFNYLQNDKEKAFNNKSECAKYYSRAEELANNRKRGGYSYVDKVFYSSKRNSCLFAVSGWYDTSSYDGNKVTKVEFENWAELYDVLTGEVVWDYRVLSSELEKENKEGFRQPIIDELNKQIKLLE